MPFSTIAPKLQSRHMDALTEDQWNLIKGNLHTTDDWDHWFHVFHGAIGEIDLTAEDYEYLKIARDHCPEGGFTVDTWSAWTKELKLITNRKGKPLFLPLRLALTGLDHGPEMKDILPLLGRERVMKRLGG